MTSHMEELIEAAKAASEAHEADIYLYSGSIEEDSLGEIAEAVTQGFNGRDRCILILATNGGSANGAFRIARFFQRTYSEFWLCCPGTCKSAGTLIALGAHGLIMDHFSELGPLDVQIVKEDEIGARKSGLLATSTFEALADQTFALYSTLMARIKLSSANQISFKLASQLAADMTAQTIGNLYNQMNPEVIGSERRSLLIAKRYGQLLTEIDNVRPHAVDHFVSCYPSHDFVIDDEEAKRWFKHVELPSEELYRVIALLGRVAREEMHDTVVLALSPNEEENNDDEIDDGADAKVEDHEDEGRSENHATEEAGTAHTGGAPTVDDSGQGASEGNAGPSDGVARKAHASAVTILHPK